MAAAQRRINSSVHFAPLAVRKTLTCVEHRFFTCFSFRIFVRIYPSKYYVILSGGLAARRTRTFGLVRPPARTRPNLKARLPRSSGHGESDLPRAPTCGYGAQAERLSGPLNRIRPNELTSPAMASVGQFGFSFPGRRGYLASLEDTNTIRFACDRRLISLRCGKGQPIIRALMRTVSSVLFSASAAVPGDAPATTNLFKSVSSSGFQLRFLKRGLKSRRTSFPLSR